MIDYIIVGQGIAGTVLHRKMTLAGLTVHILDAGHEQASSKVAAGLINPITGRKYVKSWRIEDFLPVALSTYKELSEYLGQPIFSEVTIHRALYSIKDENIWHGRMSDPLAAQFIEAEGDTQAYENKIDSVLSYGTLKGGLQVHLPKLISLYRERLHKSDLLTSARYDRSNLRIHDDHVSYGAISAKGIIFAEGYQARDNDLWKGLTFTPVKGEVLLVKIAGNPFSDVLRHKLFITPLPNDLYWIGSGYEWDFSHTKPTEEGKAKLVEQLDSILKVPYEVVDHIAGVRPAVKDRKPFLGRHPELKNVFIFNGMGTKGSSLAPYWAEHMLAYLLHSSPLDAEVDIKNKYSL